MVLVRLAPNRFGLWLNSALSAKNGDGAVENTERTLDFYGEVNVTGGVDDVDTVLGVLVLLTAPEAGRSSGGNGYTALLLLLHPVHRSGTLVNLTELVSTSGVEKNTLGSGGFSGIDVSHDADISCALK